MHENWIDADGTVASVEEQLSRNGTQYSVVFTYKVDGNWFSGTYTTSEPYRIGDTIPLSCDPANPDRNNLVQRKEIRHWVFGEVLVVMALVVLYAVVH